MSTIATPNPYFDLPEKDVMTSLNDHLLAIFTSKRSDVESKQNFVCLNPSARSYGGWGNVVTYAMTLMQLTLWLGRVPVMNHAVVQGLFQHPDHERQSWSLLPINTIRSMTNSVTGIPTCRGIDKLSPSEFPAPFGLHGCPDNYQMNLHNLDFFQRTLKIKDPSIIMPSNISSYFDEHGRRLGHPFRKVNDVYQWLMNSVATQWTFSRPAPHWQRAIEEYRRELLGHSDLVLDLAVQFRSYRDLGATEAEGTFESTGGACTIQCVTYAVDQLTRVLDRDIHVFYTGDDPRYIQRIVHEVKLHYLNRSKAPGHIAGAGHLHSHRFKLHSYTFQNAFSLSSWHTIDIMNNDRYDFNFTHVEHDTGMLDWMVFGEARHAVYTQVL